MLQTPEGQGVIELFEYVHPVAIERDPISPNEVGMHRVATYEDAYRLTYVRGPSDIIVMLAQKL